MSSSTPAAGLLPVRQAQLALVLSAFAMFAVEMAALRLVSVVTWPPFAFLALSAAMLGGGAGGTVLAVRPSWAKNAVTPAFACALLAASAPAAAAATHFAGLAPTQVGSDVVATVQFALLLVVLALPFVAFSVVLTALLEQHPADAFRLYGADLTGAALGAFATGVALDAVGTSSTLAGAGVVAGAAAFLLAPPQRVRAVVVGAAVLSALTAVGLSSSVPSFTPEKRIAKKPVADVLRGLRQRTSFDGADGRVDIVPAKPRAVLLIDGGAALARSPQSPRVDLPPTKDAASVAFAARPFTDAEDGVLVVGSAAGFEVHRALRYGAPSVDAVEVSEGVWQAATSSSMPNSKATFADPRVHQVHDEARSYLDRSSKRWSHIVAVHTISNAAMASSAMRLAEDFLLTVEGLDSLVRHLSDDGVLYMTRPASQIGLLAEMAQHTLLRHGVDATALPKHVAVFSLEKDDPFFRGLLLSKAALDDAVLAQRLTGFHLEQQPLPPLRRTSLPTDRKPFFHRSSDAIDDDQRMRLRIEGPDVAERSVLWVAFLSTTLAAIALLLPLQWRRRRQHPLPRRTHLVVALGIGVAFLLLEVNLVQRLSLFLGHPQTAFATVLGGLLLGAGGAGLLVGQRDRHLPLSTALVGAAAGAGLAAGLPVLFDVVGVLGWPTPARLASCAIGAIVVGLPLGLVFPALLRDDEGDDAAEGKAAWLFALNACASVAGSAANALLGPHLGLDGTALVAMGVYGGLAVAVVVSKR